MIIQAWVTAERQTLLMGHVDRPFYYRGVEVHVTEAFNSDGTDLLIVGDDADDNGFFTSLDVSSTGVKSPTLGAFNGYNGTSRNVKVIYAAGGTEPTTGRALIRIDVEPCPLETN